MSPDLTLAHAALDRCSDTLETLEARCCEPGRSPRMAELATALAEARSRLGTLDDGPEAAPRLLAHLEETGAKVGRLQIGCCAPNRLPLYADLLAGLTEVQLDVTRAMGLGH